MLAEQQAIDFASHWIQAWNSHNLDEILSHYDEHIVLISPIAAKLLNEATGIVTGKQALREYFKKGLEVYPDLKFELVDVMWGMSSAVLHYIDRKGTKAGEFMEFNDAGKVIKVIAHYNA